MSSSDYLAQIGADKARFGDQAYASACIKTILAAYSNDASGFPNFGGVVTAAKAILPPNHPVRTSLEADGADDNWQAHVNIMEQFGDFDPKEVVSEIAHGAKLAQKVDADTFQMFPVALADRVLFYDEAKTGAYAKLLNDKLKK